MVKEMFQFQPPTLVYLPLPRDELRAPLGKREVGGHGPRLLCLPSLETFYYRKGRLPQRAIAGTTSVFLGGLHAGVCVYVCTRTRVRAHTSPPLW